MLKNRDSIVKRKIHNYEYRTGPWNGPGIKGGRDGKRLHDKKHKKECQGKNHISPDLGGPGKNGIIWVDNILEEILDIVNEKKNRAPKDPVGEGV